MFYKSIITTLTMICLFAIVALTYGQELSNYLIVNNIGNFIASKNPSSGKGAGILVGADHFDIDHADTTYRISYFNKQTQIRPKIQITQHVGGDSDKWLLHEVDKSFRNSLGIPGDSYGPRQINGQTVLDFSAGGREYRWLSGNKVVRIEYNDLQMEKTEPIEIVQAYLTKHPSTLPAMTLAQLRSTNNKTIWIKDEMDRRLWLCDRWIAQLQPSDTKLGEKLKYVVDSMLIFFKYREQYYATTTSDNEKNLLVSYVGQQDSVNIQTKLTECKTWWAEHKADSIVLP